MENQDIMAADVYIAGLVGVCLYKDLAFIYCYFFFISPSTPGESMDVQGYRIEKVDSPDTLRLRVSVFWAKQGGNRSKWTVIFMELNLLQNVDGPPSVHFAYHRSI